MVNLLEKHMDNLFHLLNSLNQQVGSFKLLFYFVFSFFLSFFQQNIDKLNSQWKRIRVFIKLYIISLELAF